MPSALLQFGTHVLEVPSHFFVHRVCLEGLFNQGKRLHGLKVQQVADEKAVERGVVLLVVL